MGQGLDFKSIGGMAIGGVASMFGGPIAGGVASSLFSGLLGATGSDGADKMASTMGNGAGLLGGGMQPQIASQALNLFKDATSPAQQSKLLDVAIYALGGQPGGAQNGMSSLSTPNGAGAGPAGDPQAAQATANADDAQANAAPADADDAAPDNAATDGAATNNAAPAPAATSTGDASPVSSTSPSSAPMSVSGNTVNTGAYTVSASDGKINIKDNATGKFINVEGDPHVTTSDGDKADFQKNGLSIKLPDGSIVSMKPTPINDKGVSTLQSAMVEKNGQAVTMNGLTGGPITTSQPQQTSVGLEQQYIGQGQTVLRTDQNDIGKMFMTDASGNKTTEITSKDHETNLDGMGGSLANTNQTAGTNFSYNPQLTEKLGQVMNLAASNLTGSDQQSVFKGVQNVLSQWMHQAQAA